MKKYLKLMKIHHWIKNSLVFLPLVFGKQLFNLRLMLLSLCAFFTFSMLSSTIYIINDIMDVQNDRLHSVKCKRPIASGEIKIKTAYIMIVFLIIPIILVSVFVFGFNRLIWLFLLLYLVLNIFYSIGLKNIPVMDVAILTSGFIIRLLFGSLVTGIEISSWLYLTVLSMSLYIVLGKRRNEKKNQTENTRKVLQFYSYEFLDKFMFLFLGLTITFYSLWAISFPQSTGSSGSLLMWTIPLVIIICMKYSLKMENSKGGPVDIVLSDKVLLLLVGLYVIVLAGIVYL